VSHRRVTHRATAASPHLVQQLRVRQQQVPLPARGQCFYLGQRLQIFLQRAFVHAGQVAHEGQKYDAEAAELQWIRGNQQQTC